MEPEEVPTNGPVAAPSRAPLVGLVALLIVVVLALAALGPGRDAPDATTASTSSSSSSTTTAAPVSTIASTSTSTTTEAPEAGPPTLGEPVGLTMWSGGDRPLGSIDLDTGIIRQFSVRAFPILPTADRLLVFDLATQSFALFDPVTEELEPLPEDEFFTIDSVAAAPDPNSIWVADLREDRIDWRLISLRTMAPVRTASTKSIITSDLPFGIELAVGPELDVIDGQILRLTSSGYEPWMPGEVIVRDGSSALIETCAGDDCERRWFDITSGQVLPESVPELHDRNEMLGDGSWIHSFARDLSVSEFVSRDGTRRWSTGLLVSARRFDVDPSGRWAAISGQQLLRMVDLGTGEQRRVVEAAPILGAAASIVLVPTG